MNYRDVSICGIYYIPKSKTGNPKNLSTFVNYNWFKIERRNARWTKER